MHFHKLKASPHSHNSSVACSHRAIHSISTSAASAAQATRPRNAMHEYGGMRPARRGTTRRAGSVKRNVVDRGTRRNRVAHAPPARPAPCHYPLGTSRRVPRLPQPTPTLQLLALLPPPHPSDCWAQVFYLLARMRGN